MVATSFRTVIFGVIITALFFLLLSTFAVRSGQRYGVDTSDLEGGGKTNLSEANATIYSIGGDSAGWKNGTVDESDWDAEGGPKASTIAATIKLMWGAVAAPFKLYFYMFVKVIGIPAPAFWTLQALFTATLILAFWRLLKIGG